MPLTTSSWFMEPAIVLMLVTFFTWRAATAFGNMRSCNFNWEKNLFSCLSNLRQLQEFLDLYCHLQNQAKVSLNCTHQAKIWLLKFTFRFSRDKINSFKVCMTILFFGNGESVWVAPLVEPSICRCFSLPRHDRLISYVPQAFNNFLLKAIKCIVCL